MNVQTELMAALNTAHLPPQEADAIVGFIRRNIVMGMEREEGWLMPTDLLPEHASKVLAHLTHALKS